MFGVFGVFGTIWDDFSEILREKMGFWAIFHGFCALMSIIFGVRGILGLAGGGLLATNEEADFGFPVRILAKFVNKREDEIVFFAGEDVAAMFAAVGNIVDDVARKSMESVGDFLFLDDGFAVDEHAGEALVDFGGGVGVEDKGHDVFGSDVALCNEIDDFGDECAGLAGAGAGNDKGVFAVVDHGFGLFEIHNIRFALKSDGFEEPGAGGFGFGAGRRLFHDGESSRFWQKFQPLENGIGCRWWKRWYGYDSSKYGCARSCIFGLLVIKWNYGNIGKTYQKSRFVKQQSRF